MMILIFPSREESCLTLLISALRWLHDAPPKMRRLLLLAATLCAAAAIAHCFEFGALGLGPYGSDYVSDQKCVQGVYRYFGMGVGFGSGFDWHCRRGLCLWAAAVLSLAAAAALHWEPHAHDRPSSPAPTCVPSSSTGISDRPGRDDRLVHSGDGARVCSPDASCADRCAGTGADCGVTPLSAAAPSPSIALRTVSARLSCLGVCATALVGSLVAAAGVGDGGTNASLLLIFLGRRSGQI